MAAAYRDLVDQVNSVREAQNTESDMADDPGNANLRLLAGALKVMQGHSELGIIVTGAEFGESMAYVWYLSGEVNDLQATSDEKLIRLATLSKRLEQHVTERNAARSAWRNATSHPSLSARPICPHH
jgi:hypothetical protein